MNIAGPSRLREQLGGWSGGLRVLAFISTIEAVANGVFMSGSVVFFSVYSGLTAGEVALGLSLAGMSGALASLVLGVAADRVGAKRLLVVLYAAAAACFALYPFVHTATHFYPLAAAVGFLEWGRGPAKGAIVGTLVGPTERVSFQALLRTINNLGISVGSGLAVAALLIDGALLAIPLLPLLGAVAAGMLTLRLPADEIQEGPEGARSFQGVRDRWFMGVVAVSSVHASHFTILLVTLPLWIVHTAEVPEVMVPLTLLLNTAIAILLQIPLSRGAETVRGAALKARRSGWWLAGACGSLALTATSRSSVVTIALIVLAVVLLTMGEIFQSAAGWGLAFGLAPPHARGDYLGAFNLHYAAQSVLGPVVLSGFVLATGAWGWLGIAGGLITASLVIQAVAARSERSLARISPEPHVGVG